MKRKKIIFDSNNNRNIEIWETVEGYFVPDINAMSLKAKAEYIRTCESSTIRRIFDIEQWEKESEKEEAEE